MKINLNEIYAKLDEWLAERKITAESQKDGYLVNVMEKFGELSQALRGLEFENTRKTAEHEIIDALCDIAVFTINAGVDIPCEFKRTEIELKEFRLGADYILKQIVEKCAGFSFFDSWDDEKYFNIILINCAYLCEHYGFNFEIAMLETIKEISSRTGWYSANYELARIKQ